MSETRGIVQPNIEKLEELILYVAYHSQDDPAFGLTKLAKILFTIDFHAYGLWGKPVSGATYIRMPYGPYPKELDALKEELVETKRASIQKGQFFGKDQERIVPLSKPDVSIFHETERDFVDQVIALLKDDYTGTDLSDWTHELRPWLDANTGEEIPYYTVFVLRDEPLSREGREWAERRVKELQEEGYVFS